MFGYIYKMKYRDKYYVGLKRSSSIDYNYYGSGTYWKKIIKNADKSEITREILGWASNENELNELEVYHINKEKSLFNLGLGGCNFSEGGYNYPFRGKTKEQIRDIFNDDVKQKHSQRQQGENNSFYGKKHSEETKKKIKKWSNNYYSDQKNRDKVSKRVSGKNNPMYGKEKSKKMIDSVKKANSKKVIIDGVTYNSTVVARNELGISRSTIRRRINNDKFKNYEWG